MSTATIRCSPILFFKDFGAKPLPKLDEKMDAVIISVAHTTFKAGWVLKIFADL